MAGGNSTYLTKDEANQRWQDSVQKIDNQINNYRLELHHRGVPDSPWLERTLSEHRKAMVEQESYNLDAATGNGSSSMHSPTSYTYPTNYSEFYDNLANQFNTYCLEGTNPNYHLGPEWQVNCQRCVPAYEMRRRGLEVTAYPSTYGSNHLSHYPFDVWKNPDVRTSYSDGKSDIEQAMALWGDGARAQIVVVWDDGFGTSGHTFMAEQKAGRTVFFDPQTNNQDVSKYFKDVIPGKTRFCRIDNLETSSRISECTKEVLSV